MKYIIFLFFFIPVIACSQTKTGCVFGDCGFGFGVYIFPNGDRYEGNFSNHKLNGFGYYSESNGNKYTGEFKDNKFNGLGKYESIDETYYIGQFENGVRQGLGTNYFSKTYFEKGKWENNRCIEKAEFENFVVKDPNDLSADIIKIIKAAPDGFASIKGELISKLIEGTYHSKLKLRFFTSNEISSDGFYTIYFSGTIEEAGDKFEELKQLVQPCLAYDCCSYNEVASGNSDNKSYEFIPVYIRNNCDQRIKNVKIKLEYKTVSKTVTVGMRIYE